MALRKACAYSKKYARPYVRKSTVKSKNYIKAVPQSKITRLFMGNAEKFNKGFFKFRVDLIAKENVQIRDNSLEASRQALNRELDRLFPGNYYFNVGVYPHHILRENKMLTGAGADRMQTGMSHSFGVTIGRAAITKEGQRIFTAFVAEEKDAIKIKDIFERIKKKLPCKSSVIIKKVENNSIA